MLSDLLRAIAPRSTRPQALATTATARPSRQVYRRRSTDRYRPLSRAEAKSLYRRPDSFTDLLPWTEYDPASQAFLLDDGLSVAALFELTPVSCEAKPDAFMQALAEQIQGVLSEAIPEEDDSPWILQFFVQDEPSLVSLTRELQDYADAFAGDSAYTRHYLTLLQQHFQRLTQAGGLFIDETVTGTRWRGRIRRVRAVLYRRVYPGIGYRDIDGLSPAEALSEVSVKLTASLDEVGIGTCRCGARELYDWLLPWFNPAPQVTGGDPQQLLQLAPYPGNDNLPFGRDLAELLTFSAVRSELETNTWWFDRCPQRVINVQGLRVSPKAGHFTAERRAGSHIFALLDRFPEQTVLGMTITVAPQDAISNHIHRIRNASGTGGAEARLTKEDAISADEAMAHGQKIYPVSLSVYLSGSTMAELRQHTNRVHALLVSNGLQPIYQSADVVGLDSYVRQLPMAYRADYDKLRRRSRLMFTRHLACLVPLYGRSRGTGHPGIVFYNRGAAPLTFDPLNALDRTKSGHMVILGPTGAGKSATVCYLLMGMAAVHRPRLVIIESGNSFGLLGQYFRQQGLTVNSVTLTVNSDVSLPPFAEAIRLLDEGLAPAQITTDDISVAEVTPDEVEEGDETDDEQRDLLGEMEIAARIMITGGDEREDALLRRPDRLVIRKAILLAAETVRVAGRSQVITQDVVVALNTLARDDTLSSARCQRARDMADAMELFCDGLAGRFFNREGEAWPDADVTILDMGLLAREGYEDQLTVAFAGMMNRTNDRIERLQYDRRPTIVVADEGHLITKNPLLAPYVVKITKMWRKLGAWFWIATQSLQDFPDASKQMLDMAEWWLCLVMPKEEVDEVARFRQLSDEQRQLLLSARKQPGKYIEGVVLSTAVEALFRSVVPPICLALAMTEKEEKAERARIMRERGCSELAAAEVVAEAIAKAQST